MHVDACRSRDRGWPLLILILSKMCLTNSYLYARVLLLGITLISVSKVYAAMITKRFGSMTLLFDACYHGCNCYAWRLMQEERFTVNCSHHDLNQFYQDNVDFVNVVHGLPDNTTDLIVSNFGLLEIGMVSFLPLLHPLLFTFTVDSCSQVDLLSNAFQGQLFNSIRSIKIYSNLMKSGSLERGVFRYLPSLDIITVVKNLFLEVVHTGAFRALPQVKIINLTRNSIKEIQPGAFDNLPLLTTLDLSYNYLVRIPGDDIGSLSRSSLKHLILEGNRWNCSCEMGWILVLNRSIIASSGQAVCYYPPALNGTMLQQLTPKHFQHCCPVDVIFGSYLSLFLVVSTFVGVCIRILWIKIYNHRSISKTLLIGSGQIEFSTIETLGPNVFKGKLKDGRPVALKKVTPQLSTQQSKEVEILLHMSNYRPPHPNVIQYVMKVDENEATYIILELCKGNLRDLMRDAMSRRDMDTISQLTTRDCLHQITQGLHHLHTCNVEHRDIKPANILWDTDKSGKFRFIISDFDLGHFTGVQSSHKTKYGSMGWSAPELWTRGKRTSAVDIFSLGCAFFYVLTKGGHPFKFITSENTGGEEELQEIIIEEWQNNIENDLFSLEGLVGHCDRFEAELAKDLIGSMIQHCASKRPTAHDVLQHPFFWDTKQQKDFFHQVGNYVENKKDSKYLVERLEQNSTYVFQGSWMDVLDTAVKKDVKGFKEQKEQLCGLLRVIRNKTEHFQKLGQELKGIYGGSPNGVVHYYNNRFPKLLIHTYRAWHEVKPLV